MCGRLRHRVLVAIVVAVARSRVMALSSRWEIMILLWLGIETFSDDEKLSLALPQLLADDSSLAVRRAADDTVMLGAPDEDRLEAAVSQLVRRFRVKAAIRRPEVAYKLTVTRAAEGNRNTQCRPVAAINTRT